MYTASEKRYDKMPYRRCGASGVMLPAVSLGLWHNFGASAYYDSAREIALTAFDNGITHFDLANNYGVPAGSAEETFGRILSREFAAHRDELFISSKAGHLMWQGPYGDWGSRKYMIASLNQSLKRLELDYVDVFYSHRYDPNTPLEETMSALDYAVRSGKALYAGISKYPVDKAREAIAILRRLGTPCLVHQLRYSLLVREPEREHFDLHRDEGVGCLSFSPLAQGLLSSRYLNGIPAGSRAAENGFLKEEDVKKHIELVRSLNDVAIARGQSLSQMAISWQLNDDRVCSVVMGASSKGQLLENIKAVDNTTFTPDELSKIDSILNNR